LEGSVKKEGWPDFPFFWIEKPDMSSLQHIASRLHDKTATLRSASGVRGQVTDVERQMIEHLSGLQQQVAELIDVVQASLQIIDNQRFSQRFKRAYRWIRERLSNYWQRMEHNALFRVLAVIGALITLWGVVSFVIHHFHFFGK